MRLKISHLIVGGICLLGGVSPAFAQDAGAPGLTQQDVLMVLVLVMITMALVSLMLAFTIFVLVRQKRTQTADANAFSFTKWFREKFISDAVPLESEESIALDHEYDGIRELDNNLPPWWKWGFYITIGFAVVYLFLYNDFSQEEQYEEEMAIAVAEKEAYLEAMANSVDESNVTMLTDATALAGGRATFETLCASCHAADGGGGIGPNLTDPYWIHGGSIQDVFKTVKYGVPEKGMIAWADQLTPGEMHEVSSYLLTLQGTTPAAPKEPQGELWEPTETEESPATDSTLEEATSNDEVALR